MGIRSRGPRNEQGIYLSVVLAGSLWLCLVPMAVAKAPADRLALQLSTGLGKPAGVAPTFVDNDQPGFRLASSWQLGGTAGGTAGVATPPPFAPAELPLRLAQALAPASRKAGPPPRWTSRADWDLDLQSARGLNMPGAAGQGRPRLGEGAPVAASPMGDGDDDNFLPAGPARAPAGPGLSLAPAADPGQDEPGLKWVVPPIRWMGVLGYSLRRSSSDETRGLEQLANANLRGSSFIYAPWLAMVSGDIGLVLGKSELENGTGGGVSKEGSSSHSIVGSGSLDLFPASRFPFNASFSRADSRMSATVLNTQYTDTRFGLRQSYRSEDGLHNGTVSFDNSTVTGQGGTKDVVNALYGSYSVPLGGFNNNVNARFSVSEREATGEGATLFSVSSSHTLITENNFSFQAYSNYTDNKFRYGTGTGASTMESRGQYLQAASSASWQPEFEDTDDLPLTITGSLMYYGYRTGGTVFGADSQRISAISSAYYRFTPNLSVNGSGSLTEIFVDGKGTLVTTLTGGVGYAGDPLMFGNFSYNWNAGTNASWQSGSGETPATTLFSGQLSHSLGRTYIVSTTDSVNLALSQNLTGYQTQSSGNVASLSNMLMASYRLGLGDQFTGGVTSTLSDVTTTGENSQHYRALNVGLSGFGQISQRSSANVNLSFNWSDQEVKGVDLYGQQTTTQRMSMSGSASYNHSRFAGVPGLRYTFMFAADTNLRDDRLYGDTAGQPEKARFSIDNRLDYRIGLLDLRLSAIRSDAGGKKNALLFFQASRQIGAY